MKTSATYNMKSKLCLLLCCFDLVSFLSEIILLFVVLIYTIMRNSQVLVDVGLGGIVLHPSS